MVKKAVALLLTVIIVMIMLPAAFADDTRTSGLYTYTLKGNGTITIVGFDWKHNSGDIYIPSQIDGYTVTGIGEEAFARERYDAKENEVLIILPTTLTTISKLAFRFAPISSIDIPLSVKSIEEGAFAGSHIAKFSVTPGHETFAAIDGALYNKKTKALLAYPRLKDSSVVVPNGIREIGDYAFAFIDVKGAAAEILPDTLERIGDYAFYNATAYGGKIVGSYFSKIEVTLDVVEIGKYAFAKANIGDIILQANTIGDYAFCDYACTKASWINLDNSGSITIGEKVKEVGDYAFARIADTEWDDDVSAKYMKSGCSFESIGKYAFSGPSIVHHYSSSSTGGVFTIPTSSETLPEGAFRGAFNLYQNIAGEYWTYDEVVIPDGIETIGSNAFSENRWIKSFSLPETLIEIGNNAFADCPKLTELYIPASVKKIGDKAFMRETITLTVEAGSYAELWVQENGYSYKLNGVQDDLDWLND